MSALEQYGLPAGPWFAGQFGDESGWFVAESDEEVVHSVDTEDGPQDVYSNPGIIAGGFVHLDEPLARAIAKVPELISLLEQCSTFLRDHGYVPPCQHEADKLLQSLRVKS